jgi:hypothetical protein
MNNIKSYFQNNYYNNKNIKNNIKNNKKKNFFNIIEVANIPIDKYKTDKLYIDFINSYFIPQNIQKEIREVSEIEKTRIIMGDYMVNIMIYKNAEYKKMDNRYVYETILGTLGKFLNKVIDMGMRRELNMTFFFSNMEKKIGNETKILSPNEINSGFTSFPNNSFGNLYVYRKEEWEKVYIHELIHTLYIDDKFIKNEILNDKIGGKLCFNNREFINSHEAVTDFLAISHYIMGKSRDFKDFKQKMNEQIGFMKNQVLKIFNFYNISNINQISKTENKCEKFFNQKTSVFSYYYLKYLLFANFEKSWELLNRNKLDINQWNNYVINLMDNSVDFINAELEKSKYNKYDNNLRMTKIF